MGVKKCPKWWENDPKCRGGGRMTPMWGKMIPNGGLGGEMTPNRGVGGK